MDDEYEYAAQWQDTTDSWLKFSGWHSVGEWKSEEMAREEYANLLNGFYDRVRLVRRRKPGAVEVIS